MKLSKDTYLYLTNFADNRTILNMLSVNKKFNYEQFFQQVMENKYPLLVRFKKPSETWKQFFISTVYCISKINEKYNIPYYPIEGYNTKEYCNKSAIDIVNSIIIIASKVGNIEVIKELINRTPIYDVPMVTASAYGHIDIVKLMINKGSRRFNWAIKEAAKGGHIDIVKLMIQHGANNFNEAITNARMMGRQEIIDYLKIFV